MSGKLTAYDIRIMLLDLDIAEKNREHREIHWKSINEVRQALLRASLGDVEVETEEKP
jgi:hypothetical protein